MFGRRCWGGFGDVVGTSAPIKVKKGMDPDPRNMEEVLKQQGMNLNPGPSRWGSQSCSWRQSRVYDLDDDWFLPKAWCDQKRHKYKDVWILPAGQTITGCSCSHL